jgi:hypothetical protein
MNRKEFQLKITFRDNSAAFYYFKTRRKAIAYAASVFVRRDITPIDLLAIERVDADLQRAASTVAIGSARA